MLNKLSRKDIELLNILAQTSEGKSALDEYIEQHEKAVKAYKVYCESVVAEVEVPNVEKTANELRAEIIQRAKEFVGNDSGIHVIKRGRHYTGTSVEFVVNENKRAVVALMRNGSRKLVAKGIAKCNPADVYNEHIGKAIALGRALGKDVSEFENAVQPTKVVVGQEVKTFDKRGEFHMNGKVKEVMWDEERISYYKEDYEKAFDFAYDYTSVSFGFKITDDTNAQYGGEKL